MRNPELYEKYKSFITASLKVIRKKVGKKIPIFHSHRVSVEREKNGSKRYATMLIKQRNFSRLVYFYGDELKETPESTFLMDFLMKFYEDKLDPEYLRMDYLNGSLAYFLDRSESMDFNIKIFDRIYDEIENYVYTSESHRLELVPIYNFEMEHDLLSLGNGLRIRKISDDELSALLSSATRGHMPMIPFEEAMNIEYVIEMQHSIKRGEPFEDQREIFKKLVSALRLFKGGAVWFNKILSFPVSWQPMMGRTASGELYRKPSPGPKYKLAKSEAEEFKKFWESFLRQDLTRYRNIEISIKRFGYGYERDKPEDKLIDYIIALEALFLKDEGELSYRLSARTAIFLDKNKMVFEEIRSAYRLRNRIVHGSTKSLPEDFRQLVSDVEDYLRESIKRFLGLTKTQKHEKIIESIDKQIFD